MDMNFAEQRQKDLYGKDRNKEIRELKKTLTSSSVLQDGEYNYVSGDNLTKNVWNSTASSDFKKALAAHGSFSSTFEKPKISQIESHFALGNEQTGIPKETYQLSATKDDFHKKDSKRPAVRQADNTIYWPDMAPRFATDRSIGSTSYSTAFLKQGLDQQRPDFPRINTCLVNLPVIKDDARVQKESVSVNLGSEGHSYETDYSRAYSYSAPVDGAYHPDVARMMADAREVTNRMRKLEKNSSVLRKGDYNNLGQEPGSIFNLDYGRKLETKMTGRLLIPGYQARSKKSDGDDEEEEDEDVHAKIPQLLGHHAQSMTAAKFKDASDGKKDHKSVHFDFGTDTNKGASVYMKDFEPASRSTTEKPEIVSAPRDSEVLQRNPENLHSLGRSTTLTEYGPSTFGMAVSANENMIKAAQKNLLRRHGDNIALSSDKERHTEDRQASLSHSNYTGPPEEFKVLDPVKAPIADYNYLHTEVALSHPVNKSKISEAKNQFRPYAMGEEFSRERRRQKEDNTKSRLNHGRSTHFVFGYDPSQFSSEHNSNFQQRFLDQETPAAGKQEKKPDSDFTHLNASENTRDLAPEPYKVSIMESVAAQKQGVSRSLPALPSHHASIMKNDYQQLEKRKMTPAHIVMLKKDDILTSKPVASSHLFHMDIPTNVSNNFQSTAMSDFAKPETVTETRYLAAR